MKQIKCKINNSKIPKGQRQLKTKQKNNERQRETQRRTERKHIITDVFTNAKSNYAFLLQLTIIIYVFF